MKKDITFRKVINENKENEFSIDFVFEKSNKKLTVIGKIKEKVFYEDTVEISDLKNREEIHLTSNEIQGIERLMEECYCEYKISSLFLKERNSTFRKQGYFEVKFNEGEWKL